jgi:hypothetical protein
MVAERLREKATEAELNAEAQCERGNQVAAAGFNGAAIALREVAEVLEEEEAA